MISYDKTSEWTDEELPAPTEFINEKNNTKIITEHIIRDGKKIKIIKNFKIETLKVVPSIARRKLWKKYGIAAGSGPGFKAGDIQCDDIYMQFIQSKELTSDDVEDDPLMKLKGHKVVQCRLCHGEHWTTKCPYKDSLNPPCNDDKDGEKGDTPDITIDGTEIKSAKYVPPSKREGARGTGTDVSSKRDDVSTIRVTNLPEDTTESDLQQLFKDCGHIQRIYLAKDKLTSQSKGFAFINYSVRESAEKAIDTINGYGYGHLILNVEWARPSVHP